MRTTLTLEDDLAIRLEQLRAERGVPFKVIVNDVIRCGLAAAAGEPLRPAQPGRTQPLDLGRRLVADLDNVAEVLAIAEGEAFG